MALAVGVTLLNGEPARAALYAPLKGRAVSIEWENAVALLRGAVGATGATVAVVLSTQSADGPNGDGGPALPLPPDVPRIAVPPQCALIRAASAEGLLPDGGRGALLCVDWDLGGLTVCALRLSGGPPRELACVVEPALGTAQVGAHLGMAVVLPAATRLSQELATGVATAAVRQRLALLGGWVLRRYWAAPDQKFALLFPPADALCAAGSDGLVWVTRDAVHAACRRVLADVRDAVAGVVEASGLGNGSQVRVLVSGEAARWAELRAVLQSMLPSALLGAPTWPECFLARGAAQAAAVPNER